MLSRTTTQGHARMISGWSRAYYLPLVLALQACAPFQAIEPVESVQGTESSSREEASATATTADETTDEDPDSSLIADQAYPRPPRATPTFSPSPVIKTSLDASPHSVVLHTVQSHFDHRDAQELAALRSSQRSLKVFGLGMWEGGGMLSAHEARGMLQAFFDAGSTPKIEGYLQDTRGYAGQVCLSVISSGWRGEVQFPPHPTSTTGRGDLMPESMPSGRMAWTICHMPAADTPDFGWQEWIWLGSDQHEATPQANHSLAVDLGGFGHWDTLPNPKSDHEAYAPVYFEVDELARPGRWDDPSRSELENGRHLVHVLMLWAGGERPSAYVDPLRMFGLEDGAAEIALADGVIKRPDDLDNPFYLRNTDPTTLRLDLAPDATASVYASREEVQLEPIEIATLAEWYRNPGQVEPNTLWTVDAPMWVTVSDGVVNALEQQYLP